MLLRHARAGQIGADPAELARVVEALSAHGLGVLRADAASRRVRVGGTVEQLQTAFGTRLERVRGDAPDGRAITHWRCAGDVSVPAELGEAVIAVLGLDDRPRARAHFRIAAADPQATNYAVPQLAGIYRFPEDADGTGSTVAIIELGGGYTDADLAHYFGELGIPAPAVTAVGVDGAANSPGGDPSGADGEVLLDVEVVGALAPGAAQRVYFAPNTDAGFLDAISDAVHAEPTPAAISISWGQSEDAWPAQARTGMDSVLADAVTLGITVTAAAGDNGSTDGVADGRNHVDFPASSPHVLGCGGTTLHADPTSGAVESETVWNGGSAGGATGGGVSDVFARPAWQAGAGVPESGRGVPDVAAVADPQTGYRVYVDGQAQVIGGTSAVAPLWAALTARLAEALGAPPAPLGERLYRDATAGHSPPGLRDITTGNNGGYTAGPGWDACTGLGVPDGVALLAALRASGGAA